MSDLYSQIVIVSIFTIFLLIIISVGDAFSFSKAKPSFIYIIILFIVPSIVLFIYSLGFLDSIISYWTTYVLDNTMAFIAGLIVIIYMIYQTISYAKLSEFGIRLTPNIRNYIDAIYFVIGIGIIFINQIISIYILFIIVGLILFGIYRIKKNISLRGISIMILAVGLIGFIISFFIDEISALISCTTISCIGLTKRKQKKSEKEFNFSDYCTLNPDDKTCDVLHNESI